MKRSRMLLCTMFLALAASPKASPGASVIPDTEAGRRVQAYISAFNTGHPDAMRAFFDANLSPEALKTRSVESRLGIYRQMYAENGELTPKKVLEAADDHLGLAVDSRQGGLVLTFLLEPQSPHRLLGLHVEDAGAPDSPDAGPPPARAASEGQAIAWWRAYIDSMASADRFSGAVLVAKGGKPLYQAAYGEASRATHQPNRTDTKFNLGSINKIFTKLAIGQLVEQGKVRLDDTLGKYLPDYPREAASKVTVGELLDHRGGIGDIFGPEFERADHSRLREVSDWIPLFRDRPLAFEPGTQSQYSNGGYVLLGAIVEKASGENYFDYVRRHIYEPLGMASTAHYGSDGQTPNLASGYTHNPAAAGADAGTWADNGPTRPWRGSPAGGGYSTLGDLLRFTEAMRASKLLQPKTLETGFGELGAGENGEGRLGIAGGAPGINAAINMNGPYTVIVLANLDPPSAVATARRLVDWLPGVAPPGRRRAVGGPEGAGGERKSAVVRAAAAPGADPGGAEVRSRADSPPEAPERVSIPAGGADVEMLRADHLPAVRVMVNGKGPFLFGIDTGGQGSARVDSAVAAQLGLVKIGEVHAGDPSGKNPVIMDLVRLDSLQFGGARFEGLTAAVRNYKERRMGQTIDGILGFGLFQQCLLTLDYPGTRVRVENGELPPADGKDVIPFTTTNGIPSIRIQVDTMTVGAHVDAGSMGGFMLPDAMAERLPLAAPPRVVGHARTLSSSFDIRAGELQGSVRIGGHEFPHAAVEFQPVFRMANVGSRVLQDFRVTFDQRNGRMRLTAPAGK